MKQFKVLLLVAIFAVLLTCGMALRAKSKSKSKTKSRAKHRLTHKTKLHNKNQMNLNTKISSESTQGIVMKGWLKFAAVPVASWGTFLPEKLEINPAYAEQEFKKAHSPKKNDTAALPGADGAEAPADGAAAPAKEPAADGATAPADGAAAAPADGAPADAEEADAAAKQTGEGDSFGPMDIPSNVHFFFVLTKKQVFALTARRNDLARTRKSLELFWIQPYELSGQSGVYSGGLEDLGNFEYGCCFKLSIRNDAIWNICADTLASKTKWMKAFASVLKQKGFKKRKAGTSLPDGFVFGGSSEGLDNQMEEQKNGKAKKNGEWILLQDWSECSKACGGGQSFQQRMCKPATGGGTPCLGQPILEKTCNVQPCEPVGEKKTRQLEPIIKMDRASARPQRYEICVVMEGDMNLKIMTMNTDELPPQFPIRLVLNTKTLTIFSSADYANIYKAYELQYLDLKASSSEPKKCIVVSDKRDPLGKLDELCIMPQSMRADETYQEKLADWTKNIVYFRDSCKDPNTWKDLTKDEQEKALLDQDEEKKLEKIRDYDLEQNEMDNANKIGDGEKTAVDNIEKELAYEQLMIKEELQREQYADQLAKQAMNDEEDKKKCMERDRKRKDAQQKLDIGKLETDKKIGKINANSKIEVNGARKAVLKRIADMQAASALKRELAKAKIIEVRAKIASQVFRDNKRGDIATCDKNKSDKDKREYCLDQVDGTTVQIQCLNSIIDKVQYCYICCDNEFGNNYLKDRSDCAEMCDDTSNDGKAPDKLTAKVDGTWVYVPPKKGMDGTNSNNDFKDEDAKKAQDDKEKKEALDAETKKQQIEGAKININNSRRRRRRR